VRELQSIVDYGRFNPAIDPVFGALPQWYWPSSPGLSNPGYAWVVSFWDGWATTFYDGRGPFFVRAVRNAP